MFDKLPHLDGQLCVLGTNHNNADVSVVDKKYDCIHGEDDI